MKKIMRFAPYLGVALSLCLLVLAFLENRNPMMGFLTSWISTVFIFAQSAVCIFLAIVCFLHNDKDNNKRPAAHLKKRGE